jgi:hypothetical protein
MANTAKKTDRKNDARNDRLGAAIRRFYKAQSALLGAFVDDIHKDGGRDICAALGGLLITQTKANQQTLEAIRRMADAFHRNQRKVAAK